MGLSNSQPPPGKQDMPLNGEGSVQSVFRFFISCVRPLPVVRSGFCTSSPVLGGNGPLRRPSRAAAQRFGAVMVRCAEISAEVRNAGSSLEGRRGSRRGFIGQTRP